MFKVGTTAVLCGALLLLLPGVSRADSYQINGLDAHDGKIVQDGSYYYLYGTRYAQGSSPACDAGPFVWATRSPWCGFGVWRSSDKVNWTYLGLLFDPQGFNTESPIAPGESWQETCSHNGGGCFNPRMVRRSSDGVWILWFNAPDDWNRIGANAYYAMGCAGPAGPCGPGVVPNGSLHKPSLWTCYDNGDFEIVDDGPDDGAYIVCTMADQSLSIEKLDQWWTNGTFGAGQSHVGGLTDVEAPGVFAVGPYLYLTYSAPKCGYCSATGTGWARAPAGNMLGVWTPSPNLASSTSCNGQPRNTNWFDGKVWQWIDQWLTADGNSQIHANIHLEGIHLDSNWNILPFGC